MRKPPIRQLTPSLSMFGILRLLWSQFTWRHWRMAPWKTAVLIAILALGVAVFYSIRLANRAAVAGFQLFSESVTGASDFILTSPAGRLPVDRLSQMREALGDIPAGLFPVIEATATSVRAPATGVGADAPRPSSLYQVLGVDLAALPNLLYLTTPQDRDEPWAARAPGGWGSGLQEGEVAVYPSRALAKRETWQAGQSVSLIFDDRPFAATVAGILPENEFSVSQPDNLLVMDLPVLQRLTAQGDVLHRVEVRVPAGHWSAAWKQEARRRLTDAGQGRWHVETAAQRRETGGTMTRAFRLNLSILSCLSLVVGVYLILQALEAAVVRRRGEIATLRALGVSPRAIRGVWQVEALALGVAGTAAGLLLGWLLAQGVVRGIAQTVNALYFNNTTRAAAWHWGEASLAGFLGLAASMAAGWLPAREAALTPPAQTLRRGVRSDGIPLLRKPWLGLALLVLAAVAHLAPPFRSGTGDTLPWAGYAAAFLWVAGAGALAGTLFPPVAALGRWKCERSPERFHAASQIRHATGRHRLAAAGLVVAVAMAGGMSILVGSFETTVTRWLDHVLKADLFVAPQGAGHASSTNRLHPETWRSLRDDPSVSGAEVSQFYEISFENRPVRLAGVEAGPGPRLLEPIWLAAPPPGWGAETTASDAEAADPAEVIPGVMSEPFAYRFKREVGDLILVPTPSGERRVKLVGLFADYGNEFGTIVVPREILASWFGDERAARLALELREGEDPARIQSRLMEAYPGIKITNHRQLRAEALRIFHQTFAVTHGLKWIGIVVALAGLALALVSMLLERARELQTLRALGLTPRAIRRAAAWESLGVTLAGLVAGLALSFVLGHLIIHVINRQAFGWTLILSIPWEAFAFLTLSLLGVSAGVGYLTALVVTRNAP